MVDDPDHDEDYDLDDEGEEDDDLDFERRVARRQPGGDVELLLLELRDLVDQARPAPLSTAVKIDRDAVLDLVEQALARLPEDLRQARWQLKERTEFLARTQREADEILAAARGQSERMVQRSEVMRSAESKARRIVEQARADTARIRSECDDYCDQRLAQLETVLEKTMTVLAKGRERLRRKVDEGEEYTYRGDDPTTVQGPDDGADGVAFFDQDSHGDRESSDLDRNPAS
jgi:F0F1-type ATP synthase membrane subunit b/b'